MDALGINSGFLIAQIVNFVILAVILWLGVWKPMVKALETRRERIAKGIEDARVAEQARADAEREGQKVVDERRVEANRLVEEARANAETQTKSILEEARQEADSIRTRARAEATEERNAMLGDVRNQVAQIAIAAAERVIGQSLDEQKGHAIVSEFFTQAPAEISGIGGDVQVVSALPLTDEEKARLQEQTGAENITFEVNPALLGDIIVRSGQRVIDGSVRYGLNNLAGQMR